MIRTPTRRYRFAVRTTHNTGGRSEIRLIGLRNVGVLARVDDPHNLNSLHPQPGGNAPIGDKGLFPELANRGQGPPVFHEKTGHEEYLGPAQSRNHPLSVAAVTAPRKNQSCDWSLIETLWDRVCAVRAVSDAPRLGDDPQAWPALSEFIAAVDEAERGKAIQVAR